jgi:hypothetical protein
MNSTPAAALLVSERFGRLEHGDARGWIGQIPGVAASIKSSFGPFALAGEVNAALKSATFFDGVGTVKHMTPMTWQASLAYQFDWNPWVTELGGVPTRIGFVPQNRLFVTTGGRWTG